MKPGVYSAKLADYWIGKTKAGLPQAELAFEFECDGKKESMIWFGSFKEKAVPYTIKTLLICGLTGEDVSAIALGKEGGALEAGREVSIVVSEFLDESGKTKHKIDWVNQPGGANREKLDRTIVSGQLAGLKGWVSKVRQEEGLEKASIRSAQQPAQPYPSDWDDL